MIKSESVYLEGIRVVLADLIVSRGKTPLDSTQFPVHISWLSRGTVRHKEANHENGTYLKEVCGRE